ncbi:MAG: hypothetical protein ACOCY5_05225 [Desulfohalobiaceae bacterium]
MVPNLTHTQHSRFSPRDSQGSKIKYLCPELNNAQVQEALLLDQGYGGLCFKTREPLRPGSRLQLFLLIPQQTSSTAQKTQRLYLVTVRWCQKLETADSMAYKVGASFLYNECEWCGQIVPYEQLRLDSQMLLCQDCYQDLEGLNSGRLKLSVFKHLLGNVV